MLRYLIHLLFEFISCPNCKNKFYYPEKPKSSLYLLECSKCSFQWKQDILGNYKNLKLYRICFFVLYFALLMLLCSFFISYNVKNIDKEIRLIEAKHQIKNNDLHIEYALDNSSSKKINNIYIYIRADKQNIQNYKPSLLKDFYKSVFFNADNYWIKISNIVPFEIRQSEIKIKNFLVSKLPLEDSTDVNNPTAHFYISKKTQQDLKNYNIKIYFGTWTEIFILRMLEAAK